MDQPQTNPPQQPVQQPPPQPAQGMQSNVAAALSYVLGFLTGTYFFLTNKDKFVRFHAMQSIITSLACWVIIYVVSYVPGIYVLIPLLNLAYLGLFIFLIFKAYKNEKYKLPYIGDIAEKNS